MIHDYMVVVMSQNYGSHVVFFDDLPSALNYAYVLRDELFALCQVYRWHHVRGEYLTVLKGEFKVL